MWDWTVGIARVKMQSGKTKVAEKKTRSTEQFETGGSHVVGGSTGAEQIQLEANTAVLRISRSRAKPN